METKKFNPFRVLIKPREFLREEVAKTRRASLVIAWLIGMTYLFGKAYTLNLGDTYLLSQIVLFCVVFALPIGYLILYVTSFFLYWIGKIFKGKASFDEVFSAYTWSRLPEGFILIGWLGLCFVAGGYVFTDQLVMEKQVSPVVLILILWQMIFAIWELIILFHLLAEVQKISAWIAIWNVLFAWIVLLCMDVILNLLLIKGIEWRQVASLLFL